MTAHFYKYQGTGNDFIILDNRNNSFDPTEEKVSFLCHRRFGIGADGLMLLQNSEHHDFSMRYFNSDGREGTMCGNGGRSMVSLAYHLGLIKEKTVFDAIDGVHEAQVTGPEYVSLRMSDVKDVEQIGNEFFLNTGSPHFVRFMKEVKSFPVFEEGKKIRYSSRFQPSGTNVNFVEMIDEDTLFVRTYERGVEDETLSCGTGVTASSLSAALFSNTDKKSFDIQTLGGKLKVSFIKRSGSHFTDIYLEGPANFVFEGEVRI